jgi:hypothetical protein
MFLSMAGFTNMFIWIYFILSIKTYIPKHKKFKRGCYKVVNVIVPPVIALAFALFGIGLIWGCSLEKQYDDMEKSREQYKPIQRYMFILGSVLFGILGLSFMMTGLWLRKELRMYNEDIEQQLK